MAADSDGSSEPKSHDDVTTIVTCEGDYYDPEFHDKFKITLGKLENILCDKKQTPRKHSTVKNSPCRTDENDYQCEREGDISDKNASASNGLLKVSKLEPWNSVRVTLSIPREAAARLRQMANEGSAQLRQLGILSVQVEGDQVISLRIASRFGNENETQEIVLNTTSTSPPSAALPSASTSDQLPSTLISHAIQTPVQTTVASSLVQASTSTAVSTVQNGTPSEPAAGEFRSPNVVCPSDTQVPLKAATVTSNLVQAGSTRPFPFASMQQAAFAIQNRSQQDFHNFTVNSRSALTPNTAQTPSQIVGGNPISSFSTSHPQPPLPPPYPSNKIASSNIQQHLNPTSSSSSSSSAQQSGMLAPSGQNIAISSPLLVNLLQNEGTSQNQKSDSKLPNKISKVPVSNQQIKAAPASQQTATSPHLSAKLNVDTMNRVPPLPQQVMATFDNSTNVVQNVQTSTSTSVPSPHLNNKPALLASQQTKLTSSTLQRPQTIPPPPPPPPLPNPRLQQTQQLRNLQQQLIVQQQQRSMLNQQKILANPSSSSMQHQQQLRNVQNYRAAPAIPSAMFNNTINSSLPTAPAITPSIPVNQPPPYPGNNRQQPAGQVQSSNSTPPAAVSNRTPPSTSGLGLIANSSSFPPDFQQRSGPPPQQTRLFNQQQFSLSTNVPDHILPYGQTVAQPMPHLGHQLNSTSIDTSLSNITPSLTDLSKTDLDSLLPTITDLEGSDLINDIAKDIVDNLVPEDVDNVVPPSQPSPVLPPPPANTGSANTSEPAPIEIPDELTSKGKKRVFLINPANGQLEPMPSDSSSSESEPEEDGEKKKDSVVDVFSELNDYSNSIYSDDDTNSKKGFDGTDQSDSESKISSDSSNNKIVHRQKNNTKVRQKEMSTSNFVKKSFVEKSKEKTPTEKIKLRLKLEKNEPVNPAYKVDVSFVNRQEPARANPANQLPPSAAVKTPATTPTPFSSSSINSNPIMSSLTTNSQEEPRVPPLHISLRGRNSVVISNKTSKKHISKTVSDSSSSVGIDNFDDKQFKKSKIRKDRDGIKVKNRFKDGVVLSKTALDDFDSDSLKLKSPTDLEDITISTYKREPGEIIMPPLKSFDKLKSSTNKSKSSITLSKSIVDSNSAGVISNYDSSSPTNSIELIELNKNHKKPKTEFLNKVGGFKSSLKLDKNKPKSDLASELKKFDEIKASLSLKRQHTPSPNSVSAVTSENATPINGLIPSPDTKKRKLSDSILEMPNITPPSTPVICMNNIGSTNIGTIPSSIQNSSTTTQQSSSTNSLLARKLYHSKSNSPVKSHQSSSSALRRDKERSDSTQTTTSTTTITSVPISNFNKIKDGSLSIASDKGAPANRTGVSSKSKDLNRDKTYSKIVAEKRLHQQQDVTSLKSKLTDSKLKLNKIDLTKSHSNKLNPLSLPTAGELDMEAKFKQRLMEDTKPRNFQHDKLLLDRSTSIDHKQRLAAVSTKVVLNRMDDAILHNRIAIKQKTDVSSPTPQQQAQQSSSVEDNLRQLLEEHVDDPVEIRPPEQQDDLLGDINLAQILTDGESNKEHDSTKLSSSSSSNQMVVTTTTATQLQQPQTQTQPNRSPPLSNSTGQGEDSGIESMDALSEKSPNNQSSQSPHCHTEIISNLVDTLTGKDNSATNIKDFHSNHLRTVANIEQTSSEIDRMLKKPTTVNDLTELGDIEAELAKMEGYDQNGDCITDPVAGGDVNSDSNLVAQLKSELETSYNIKDSDDAKSLPSKEDILEHIKSFSDNKFNTQVTDYLSKNVGFEVEKKENKDLNENKSLTKNYVLTDDCCTINRQTVATVKIEERTTNVEKIKSEIKLENKSADVVKEDEKKEILKDDSVYDFKESVASAKAEEDTSTEAKSEIKLDSIDTSDSLDLLNHNRDSPVDFDPLPIRRTPPLYTYSNPDKLSRNETESPIVGLSDIDDISEGCHSDINSEDLNDAMLDVKNEDSTNSSSKVSLSTTSLRRRCKQTKSSLSSSSASDSICLDAKQKSLLEQLLIEIPNSNEFLEKGSFSSSLSGHSPAISEKSISAKTNNTRNTRASSKLNSPDIVLDTKQHNLRTPKHSPSVVVTCAKSDSRANSPAVLNRASPKITQKSQVISAVKRKRRESESSTQSTQSMEDVSSQQSNTMTATRSSKKPRKPENSLDNKTIKSVKSSTNSSAITRTQTKTTSTNNVQPTGGASTRKLIEESSDSDEPLIEIAGKVRSKTVVTTRNKLNVLSTKGGPKLPDEHQSKAAVVTGMAGGAAVLGIRRSVRHNTAVSNNNQIALKTRSKLGVVNSTVSSCGTNVTSTNTTSIAQTVLSASNPIGAGLENNTASTESAAANRRKTRSAVTESSSQEKRLRRNSKDGK